MGTKLSPHSQKITLVEIDFGQAQTLFFNWTAGVWYVDFDAIYALIDPIYLVGVYPQPAISMVGSVMENGIQLATVATVALCISTNASFFYDITDRRLYIHLAGGAEPSTRIVIIGVTAGISNRDVSPLVNLTDYGNCESSSVPVDHGQTGMFVNGTFAQDTSNFHEGKSSYRLAYVSGAFEFYYDLGSELVTQMGVYVAGRTYTRRVWVYVPSGLGLSLVNIWMAVW